MTEEARAKDAPKTGAMASSVALVAANLIPLVGVLYLRWDLFSVLMAFWVENVVVGLFNIPKMLIAQGPRVAPLTSDGVPVTRASAILFFIVHYGGFTIVHGVFVFLAFGSYGLAAAGKASGAQAASQLGPPLVTAALTGQVALMFAGLLVSHCVSFWANFIGQAEYKRVAFDQIFVQPYARVMVMHLTILGGAFAIAYAGAAKTALVAILVVLKIVVDLASHWWERRKFRGARSRRPRG